MNDAELAELSAAGCGMTYGDTTRCRRPRAHRRHCEGPAPTVDLRHFESDGHRDDWSAMTPEETRVGQALPPPVPASPAVPPPPPAPTRDQSGPTQTAAIVNTASSSAKSPGAGSFVLNLLWLVLSGFWLFLAYLFAGVLQCLTIVGIPFGIQSFKLAGFALWPFGRSVVRRPGASPSLSLVGNIIWLVLSGIWLALAHALLGIVLCITIIGIPLGLGNFKLIPLALMPFGKDIIRNGSVVGTSMVTF